MHAKGESLIIVHYSVNGAVFMTGISSARQLMSANIRTSFGNISVIVDRVPAESQRPVVLMLHGLLREAGNLAAWYDIIPPSLDLVIADLPGHGRSPGQGAATVEAMAQRLREAIRQHFAGRPVIAVGESIGGLIALALGDGNLPEIKGVIAADPPLSTCKQWPVCAHLANKIREIPSGDYRRTLFSDLLGYDDENEMREKLYYDLVRDTHVPTLILSGDMPLWPGWRTFDFRKAIPSLIDDVDRYVISLIGNERVTLETVSDKGHVLFDQPDPAMQKKISDFCSATLSATPPAHSAAGSKPVYSDTLMWR
jgi:pimeloyl-ACP methyl ester carboxylesterase